MPLHFILSIVNITTICRSFLETLLTEIAGRAYGANAEPKADLPVVIIDEQEKQQQEDNNREQKSDNSTTTINQVF